MKTSPQKYFISKSPTIFSSYISISWLLSVWNRLLKCEHRKLKNNNQKMDMMSKKQLYDDLIDTMSLCDKTSFNKTRSTKKYLPPGHRLPSMVSRLDRYRRCHREIGQCIESALRFARRGVELMGSYEKSIANLEEEMKQSSDPIYQRRSKHRKLRKPVKSI